MTGLKKVLEFIGNELGKGEIPPIYKIIAKLEEEVKNEKLALNLPVVNRSLPTKEEIAIEGHRRYPIDLKDDGIDYTNGIQRRNFINGANWLKTKQI
ncbi:hypothetical protein [uncultured Lutibacter sp.]|uniref:hypothetical protein n=1 Tax=uncultured Lutibacter sp. TaxID=437739 RepID=UPI00262CEDDA|nr:hypothetical protein [uncultured Lutibacter sp.]